MTTTTAFGSATRLHGIVQAKMESQSPTAPDTDTMSDLLWLLVAVGALSESEAEAILALFAGGIPMPLPTVPDPTDPSGPLSLYDVLQYATTAASVDSGLESAIGDFFSHIGDALLHAVEQIVVEAIPDVAQAVWHWLSEQL